MARTQMRLDAITGSLVAIKDGAGAQGAVAGKSLEHLEDILSEFAGATARIHGKADFTDQDPGRFSIPVSSSLTAQPAVVFDGSSEQTFKKQGGGGLKMEVDGANHFKVVVNSADKVIVTNGFVSASVMTAMSGSKVLDLLGRDGSLVLRNGDKQLVAGGGLVYESSTFKISGAVSGSGAFTGASAAFDGALSAGGLASLNGGIAVDTDKFTVADGSGNVITKGTLDVDGAVNLNSTLDVDGAATLASAVVENLTASHVVYAGVGGAITGSAEMIFAVGTGLTLTKDLSARSGSFSGDVTITGNLLVSGDTVTVNVGELTVEDQTIMVNKNGTSATATSAGLEVYRGSANEANPARMVWNETDGMFEFKLGASTFDQIKVDNVRLDGVKSALFLKSDVDGDIEAGTATDFGNAMSAQLVAGTGVTLNTAAGYITASIGQDVATSANVTFAGVKVSGLSSAPLEVDSDGDLTEMNFTSWVLGTANQVVVSGSGTDYHGITLSLPQDIHSGASPEFAALALGAYGDLLASGSDFKVQAAQDLFLADAQGAFKLSEAAGDWTSFVTNFGNVSLVEALNSLAGGSVAGKGKWVKAIPSDIAGGAYSFASADQITAGTAAAPDLDAAGDRTEIYLNGQLMVAGADYSVAGAQVDFEFDLKADDVVVAIIR